MKAILALLLALAPAQQDDVEAKLKEFADTMKSSKGDAEQIRAINDLAATRAYKAATKLLQVVAGPYSEAVRVAAADAIGKIGDVRAGSGLMGFVSSLGPVLKSEVPSRVVDQKVGEAPSGGRHPAGQVRHQAARRHDDQRQRPSHGGVVKALGKIRDPGCMDALLKLHYAANAPEGVGAQNIRKPLAPHTLEALRRITARSTPRPTKGTSGTRASAAASSSRPRSRCPASRPR
jgi:HEAT repeat protein